jgi:predicted SnoaL-like aldol condensation-catalyzing enzyme
MHRSDRVVGKTRATSSSRHLAEGDYVSIHGRYTGWGPKPMIAVDIFRVANGKIVEHWDVMQEEVRAAQSANGNSMFIGS